MEKIYDSFYEDIERSLISDYSKRLLEEIYINKRNNNIFQTIIDFLSGDLRGFISFKELFLQLTIVVFVFFIFELIKNSLFNSKVMTIVEFVLHIGLSGSILISINRILNSSILYIKDISVLIGIFSPTAVTLLASGGNVASAAAGALSFSLFLSLAQIILNIITPAVISFFLYLCAMEILSLEVRMIHFTNYIKNTVFAFFAIAVTVYFIVMGYSNSLAANTDTISAKTLKLLVSNAVPIVGGAVGDAMKFAGGSIMAVKNSVGTMAMVFIIGIFIVIIGSLFLINVMIGFFVFLCEYFDIRKTKAVLSHLKCAVDFLLASSSVIAVTAIINIGTFINIIPAVLE